MPRYRIPLFGFVPPFAVLLGAFATAEQTRPAFEAASVKVHPPGDTRSSISSSVPNRFSAVNMNLKTLIVNAYDIPFWQLDDIAGPMATARFDVTATTDGPRPEADKHLMLRTLLEDRFRLVLTHRVVEREAYVLLVDHADGRLGPNLKRTSDDCAKIVELIFSHTATQRTVPLETRRRCLSESGAISSATGWQVSHNHRAILDRD